VSSRPTPFAAVRFRLATALRRPAAVVRCRRFVRFVRFVIRFSPSGRSSSWSWSWSWSWSSSPPPPSWSSSSSFTGADGGATSVVDDEADAVESLSALLSLSDNDGSVGVTSMLPISWERCGHCNHKSSQKYFLRYQRRPAVCIRIRNSCGCVERGLLRGEKKMIKNMNNVRVGFVSVNQ